ncbi:hypothetical protein ACFPES_26370 [Paenibacillus sp. GCM10023248]|uniref:hypothetical protein n=1 Tax=Bacillales TaxID=1385 RepID=UPI0023782344|nr:MULTISPECIES: hypothetical protein [Bacillales]MDD9270585.1 hypothetical protein [Paenibacillus sp. MAHUQ-63]MDR6884747.1 hypothetical protein [Bacillus sp. 3255]
MWWAIATIGVVSACIAVFELRTLTRERMHKEAWSFSVLLLLGAGLNIALFLRIDIPNPLEAVIVIYKPFSEALLSLLR